jgi:hypothetical protein
MRLRLSLVWAAVAIGVGLVVLLAFFIPYPPLMLARQILVDWAVLLAAWALLLGLLNLLLVHWTKVSQQDRGWPYSALLLLFFLVTLALGLLFGPDSPILLFLFNHVQLPVEASLMALLAVTLTVAGFRIVARKRDLVSLVFILVGFLVLVGTGPWLIGGGSTANTLVRDIRNWLAQVWAAGGARGILLGVALGATATGLRVLLAADRPYGE